MNQEQRLCGLADLARLEKNHFEAKVRNLPVPEPHLEVSSVVKAPRILHIIQSVTGGGGARAMIALAKHSRRVGDFEHRAVSLLPADATGLELANQADLPILNAPSHAELCQAMANADLVLVHWWNNSELAALFRRELPPMRLALWLHVGGYHAPQVLTPELIDFADLTVACSPHTYAHPVFANLPHETRAQRTAMVLAGADFDRLHGLAPHSHEGFQIGYIGTLDPVKMHSDFVAMSCAAQVPEAKFIVCGGGDSRWLASEAEKLGRSTSFDFKGHVEDVRVILETLDVYGYPLCADTYAAAELNLQEVMFAGIPVVAFPHGGIGKLIQHNETGLLVETPEGYARALEFLHQNPAKRVRLGANAAAFARKFWGAENAAREFNVQFERLLTQAKREREWDGRRTNEVTVDLRRDLAIHPGARMFVESLAEGAQPFLDSLTSSRLENILAAEERIAGLPRLMHYTGVLAYRNAHPKDPLLQLWAGLGFLHSGNATDALGAFALAQQNGFTHWRIHWYRGVTAELAEKGNEAAGELKLVLKAAPDFTPAREMLESLGYVETSTRVEPILPEAARGCVQQAERFLQQGDLANARNWLERALDIAPNHPELMEALQELDFQLQHSDEARIGTGRTGHLPVPSSYQPDGTGNTLPLETGAQKNSGASSIPSGGSPLVSVLVSTYASEKYLRACLEDLQAQTIADKIEIIVIDSGSPENERAVVEDFQKRYSNIRYVRTERETLYAAWNRGVQMARGKYVTNANSDDSHRADALEFLVNALETNPEADLSYGDYYTTHVPNDTFPPKAPLRWVQHPPYHPAILHFYCVTGCHPMWRRNVFDKIGLFDTQYTAPGDYEFLLRFASHGLRAVHVPQPISLFYQNQEGLSFKSRERSEREFKAIQAKYRAQIPIERLFRVDPSDTRSVARGWTALGNLAMCYVPPWFDNACQDFAFALHCYQTALRHNAGNAAARFNLMLTTALHEPAKIEEVLLQLPPEELRRAKRAIASCRFELIAVDVPPAIEPPEYGRLNSLPRGADCTRVLPQSLNAPGMVNSPVRWLGEFFALSESASAARALVPTLASQVTLAALDKSLYSEVIGASMPAADREALRESFLCYPFLRGGVTISHGAATDFQVPTDTSFRVGWTSSAVDGLPENWVKACNQMDEIWVPSQFNVETFAASGVERDKLLVVSEAVDEQEFDPARHTPLSLPNRAAFNFLSIFEWSSRKGWDVLLSAYLREFSAEDDVCLYLRTYLFSKPDGDPSEALWKLIREHAATLGLGDKKWPRIELLAEQVPLADLPQLYRAADCLVAPSRGEGWGRPHHEAMMMGLPVIATNWSGNTEFMNEENSYLLDYELTDINQVELELWHYRGQRWANPSESHLRTLMRRVQQHPAEAREKGSRARAHMLKHFSRGPIADQVVRRLQAIEQKLTVPSCPATTPRISNVVPEAPVEKRPTIHVAWEGSFLDLGSLSHVNREITSELASEPGVKLTRVGKNVLPANLAPWPGMQETARRLVALPSKQTQVTVRHSWPPSWERPVSGAWVLVQPWEFGALPAEWVKQLARVDEVWAPSEYVRRVYVESGVAPHKVKVVPNGIDPERFHPNVVPLQLATSKSFKFLFVGGTIHRKGPDLLLKAFLDSFTAADDVCLVIKDFGGQSVYAGQTFEAQIKAAQAQPNAPEILYINKELSPEALPGLYTACDCLVHPYRGEGFGLPVLEAMACGLPVVVTSGGSTDDFATDEFAYRLPALRKQFGDSISGMKLVKPGWLLEPDANALAERLKWIVAHRDEARAKGSAASDYVRREWTWNRAARLAGQRLQHLVAAREAASIPAPRRAPKMLTAPPVASFGNLARARELLSQGQMPCAWNETIFALSVRPYHPEAFLLLAEIARTAGDSVRAKKLAEHACKLAPKWKPTQQFLKSSVIKNAIKVELPPLADSFLTNGAPRLTVCLITKNEERFLGSCLESIRDIAQQIIVMDTGSTDATREIAALSGAEVFSFAWCDDFSAARNAALERATGDWILFLDADEELLADQREQLRKLMQDPSAMAFRLPMIDEGREEEGVSYVPRLFRNAPGLFYAGCVHEHVFLSVEVRRQEWGLSNKLGDATLLHHGYTTELMQSRGKSSRNLKLLQKALGESPDDPNLLMNLGLELARAGRLQDGIEQYDAAFRALSALPANEVAPEFRETLLTQFCTHLVTLKDFARVARVLRSSLARAGGLTATLHWLLGLACIESRNFAEGAEQMRQCLVTRHKPALSPANKNILKGGPNHCLALCLAALKQRDDAGKAFRAALQEEPTARPVRLDYARFLAESGQEVEALNGLHQLVTEDSSDVRAWHLGGHVALSKPEFLEFACDWTSEAMKSHGDQPAIIEQRATALLLSGKPNEALLLWKKLDDRRNHSYRAAIIICETLLDQRTEAGISDVAGPVNQEFVFWYRRLLGADASQMIEVLNQRMDSLRRVVPEAVRLLEAALAETDGEMAK
ncbi:MAG TPA: glycosyltransferase [Candidatus Limnocylindria bacterium]|nr:glycosyltransferase [Candidatus Limnocylindria bacterium]